MNAGSAGSKPSSTSAHRAVRASLEFSAYLREPSIAFGALLRRLPRLEPVGPPTWKPTFVLRGLQTLRVRV